MTWLQEEYNIFEELAIKYIDNMQKFCMQKWLELVYILYKNNIFRTKLSGSLIHSDKTGPLITGDSVMIWIFLSFISKIQKRLSHSQVQEVFQTPDCRTEITWTQELWKTVCFSLSIFIYNTDKKKGIVQSTAVVKFRFTVLIILLAIPCKLADHITVGITMIL